MKTGFLGEYLDPRGMRMGSGKGSTMRNFIVFYHSFNTIVVIKSRILKWAEHVARTEKGRAFKNVDWSAYRK